MPNKNGQVSSSRSQFFQILYHCLFLELDSLDHKTGAKDMAYMFDWYQHPACNRDPNLATKLLKDGAYPGHITSFEEWCNINKDKLISSMK